MKKIILLHAFSANAIGLEENDLLFSHSKPHELALRMLRLNEFDVYIDYFTGKRIPYFRKIKGIKKRFFSVTNPLFKDKHKWRKQHSFWHYVSTYIYPADFTIINMSGHGSKYIFKLSELLIKKQKPYAAMIGGMNMSISGDALIYYQNAHHIIVHTSIQKKVLRTYDGFKNIDIRVLPLGVDSELFIPINNYSMDVIKLLYVGRVSRLKQIEIVIEALYYIKKSQNKQVILNIIGPKSDISYYNEILKLIEKLDLIKNVIFLGTIVQKELVQFYQNSNLLLLPSAHESFGMVIVEAMACGTPAAAIKGAGGPDEIIDNGLNGILCHKDNYSQNILDYFKNEKKQIEFSKEARSKVLKKYTIEETFKVLKKSVEDALKEK